MTAHSDIPALVARVEAAEKERDLLREDMAGTAPQVVEAARLLAVERTRADAAEARVRELEEAITPFLKGMVAGQRLYAHFANGKPQAGVGDDVRLYAPAKQWRQLVEAAHALDLLSEKERADVG